MGTKHTERQEPLLVLKGEWWAGAESRGSGDYIPVRECFVCKVPKPYLTEKFRRTVFCVLGCLLVRVFARRPIAITAILLHYTIAVYEVLCTGPNIATTRQQGSHKECIGGVEILCWHYGSRKRKLKQLYLPSTAAAVQNSKWPQSNKSRRM